MSIKSCVKWHQYLNIEECCWLNTECVIPSYIGDAMVVLFCHCSKIHLMIAIHTSEKNIICTPFYRVRLLPDIHRTHSSVNLFGATTLYVIIFLASSVLSLALANLGYIGYFYCLCLLYVIINNDILQRALQSVTKNCEWFLVAILM